MASKRFTTAQVLGLISEIPKMESARFHLKHMAKTAGFSGLLQFLSPTLLYRLFSMGLSNALPTLLLFLMEKNGDREALVSGSTRLSYAQFKDRGLRLANFLLDKGIEPKEKIATYMFNSHQVLEMLFAGSLAGCPCPGVNWHLSGPELVKTINITKPRVLAVGEEFVDRVVAIKDEIPSVKVFLVAGKKVPPGMTPYEEAVTFHGTEIPRERFILAISPYTSGTTGIPKSVNLHDGVSFLFNDKAEAPRTNLKEYTDLLFKALNASFHLGVHKISKPRSMVVTPLYHAGTIAGFLPVLFGATLVLVPQFDPEKILKTIQDERISWTFMVPTMLRRIANLPDDVKAKYDLSSMKSLISAAAPCPPALKREMNELFISRGAAGPVFHEYYGSSETMIVTVLNPDDYAEKPERINSVGKVRSGDLKIIDPLNVKELPDGRAGSVCIRTVSTLTLNYGGEEDLLKKSYYKLDDREYYIDGVIGYKDEDGFVYLTDRIKDMVISGGVNVFPGDVEKALIKHPSVDDVAVFGVPDDDLGEVMRAEVQLLPGHSSSEKEMLDFLKKEGLFGYKLPKYVGFMEKLPRRIDGKMMKRELKSKYWPDGTRG
ncbi:MAG: AMP-binding protein [Deltaproteobacteria bacterium]|nr:AMP-binding protein [Deltaproteobacteria bacterium]